MGAQPVVLEKRPIFPIRGERVFSVLPSYSYAVAHPHSVTDLRSKAMP
jgi:hypothetical protein